MVLGTAFNGHAQTVDTTSYSVGMSLGQKLKSQGASGLDYQSLLQGLSDVLDNKATQLDKRFSDSLNYEYFQNKKELMISKVKEEGEKFLVENGKRPEVVTTESGLQYEILTPAEGLKPTAANKVTVHYVGKLLSGEMFDSSVDRGQPATFPLNAVISGWTEGLQLMSVGAKYRFYLPQNLAYGSRGAGAAIPPFATLVFDVELLGIQ